jgi:hypothetical protein
MRNGPVEPLVFLSLFRLDELAVLASDWVEAKHGQLFAVHVHFVALALEAVSGFLGCHPNPRAVAFFGHNSSY